jgi:hypothetical protein
MIQKDICEKFTNEDGKRIAVLPVKVLNDSKDALLIE